jgi:hypothetical protein
LDAYMCFRIRSYWVNRWQIRRIDIQAAHFLRMGAELVRLRTDDRKKLDFEYGLETFPTTRWHTFASRSIPTSLKGRTFWSWCTHTAYSSPSFKSSIPSGGV